MYKVAIGVSFILPSLFLPLLASFLLLKHTKHPPSSGLFPRAIPSAESYFPQMTHAFLTHVLQVFKHHLGDRPSVCKPNRVQALRLTLYCPCLVLYTLAQSSQPDNSLFIAPSTILSTLRNFVIYFLPYLQRV